MVDRNYVEWGQNDAQQVHIASGLEIAEWHLLRDEVLQRDQLTCQRCQRRFRYKKKFFVHHLIPLGEGGTNDQANLITLCLACHDFVGRNNLRTSTEIGTSFTRHDFAYITRSRTAQTAASIRE